MRIAFTKGDFDALASLWNHCYSSRFEISPEVLRMHTVESPVFDWGASCIELDDDGRPCGFVAVKRSATPQLYRGMDPDASHISAIACMQPKLGVDLMAYVKSVLRNRGCYRLIFGQDDRHLLPGCPTDNAVLRDFLIIEGFEQGATVHDLRLDLRQYEPPEDAGTVLAAHQAEVRPLTPEDVGELRTLLHREFRGRWEYDTILKEEADGPSCVWGLFVEGSLCGFALVQKGADKLHLAAASFPAELQQNWSTVGPIGVARGRRKKGLGDALLASVLSALREQGHTDCVVDWTGLTEWYGRHGFETWNTYQSFALRLDEQEI